MNLIKSIWFRGLKSEEGLVNISYVASRVKMLAKFVAQQMSGPDPLIRCIDHQLEIHLREIMNSIERSVIPLGMLRVGSFLERALLFKVMADRIHLPAALVRGEYGGAWIEVAVAVAVPAEVQLEILLIISNQGKLWYYWLVNNFFRRRETRSKKIRIKVIYKRVHPVQKWSPCKTLYCNW